MTAARLARRPRRIALACVLAGTVLAAGCGTAASPAPQVPSHVAAGTMPLASSLTTADGTWAVVVMGNQSTQDDSFWQLLTLPSGGTQWSLATPPGVADNGGLIVTGDAAGTSALRVAFRPSQDLTFSPLASTTDGGRTWATGLLDAGIAAVPDALAERGGTMLALLSDGAIDTSDTSGARWNNLAGAGAIATSAAGQRCQITDVTAVSLTPAGTPLAGAACSKAGSAGIFAYNHGSWQATGPAVGGQFAGQDARVLRLTATSEGNSALIMTGTGHRARLFAAWTSDGSRWTVSPPLPADAGQVPAAGTGAGGLVWVMPGAGHAAVISEAGGPWHALPALPAGTATLASVPGGAIDALTVDGESLTIFRLASPAGSWARTQVIKVPLQLGSSS